VRKLRSEINAVSRGQGSARVRGLELRPRELLRRGLGRFELGCVIGQRRLLCLACGVKRLARLNCRPELSDQRLAGLLTRSEGLLAVGQRVLTVGHRRGQ
jgi:hypothetical protein